MIENISSHWQSFSLLTAAMIFFAYMLVDALYAYYTQMVIKKDPLKAANFGSAIYFISAIGVLTYIDNYLYIVPLVVVSWFGTYIVVRNDLKREG